MPEHAVIFSIPGPGLREADIVDLDDELQIVFEDLAVGEYDGYDWAADGSVAKLYFYGPDAQELFVNVFPELVERKLMGTALVILRYGSADDDSVDERRFHMTDIDISRAD